jgi:hypothetical protein
MSLHAFLRPVDQRRPIRRFVLKGPNLLYPTPLIKLQPFASKTAVKRLQKSPFSGCMALDQPFQAVIACTLCCLRLARMRAVET